MTTAFDLISAETPAEERAEPSIEAIPRLGREAFGYLEPRAGLDGKQLFGCCGSCQHFTPEAAMTGAKFGNRCAVLGSGFSVKDEDSCRLYVPWGSGMPCGAVVMFNALELRKGVDGGMSPYQAGFKWSQEGRPAGQCGNCKFHDASEPGLPAGKVECEAFDELNECCASLFNLDKLVDAYGGCSLYQPPPVEPMEGMEP